MRTTLHKVICGFGLGFHGEVELALDRRKNLELLVGGKLMWSSARGDAALRQDDPVHQSAGVHQANPVSGG